MTRAPIDLGAVIQRNGSWHRAPIPAGIDVWHERSVDDSGVLRECAFHSTTVMIPLQMDSIDTKFGIVHENYSSARERSNIRPI